MFVLLLLVIAKAAIVQRTDLIPAVEKRFPTSTSTDMAGYNGTAACIADRGRL